jgi:IclR family acetate operon transcriptional repressor
VSTVEPGRLSATEKTLAVIEALDEARRLGEIAERAGLPKPTVHRILQTLVERDFARAVGEGRYQPGPRILALAGQVLSDLDYPRQFGPELRRLQERTSFTVHGAMLSGDEAIYVEKIEGQQPYRMASRVGMRLPLHATGIGKAVLAALPEDEALALLERTGMPRRSANTITTERAMREEMRRIRARGFAIDDEENEANIRCVAAVVYGHLGRPVGGVSVSTLTFELSADGAAALAPEVMETAARISAALGAPAPATPAAA